MPRESVEGGERGDATGCSGEYAAAEAHRFGKRFRAAVGFRDEKSGTPQFVCQIRGDQCLGDVMEAGERNVACTGSQGGQRAFHRRMAKQGLQSFADGGKYHA